MLLKKNKIKKRKVKTIYDHSMTLLASQQISKQVLNYGLYDKNLVEFILDLLPEDGSAVVFDMGAGIGSYALAFSSKARLVYAFEPASFSRQLLQRNIDRNRIANILLINQLLANEPHDIAISTLSYKHFPKQLTVIDETIHFIKGDDFIEMEKIHRMDFIRIDNKGYELETLQGLTQAIKRFRPIILLDYDPEESGNQWLAHYQQEQLFTRYQVYALGNNLTPTHVTQNSITAKLKGLFQKKAAQLYSFPQTNCYNALLVPIEKLQQISPNYFS